MLRKLFIAVLVTAALGSGPVLAQTGPGDAPEAGAAGAAGSGGGPAARLRAAHDRLGITAAQQPQWDAMVAVMREDARAMRANPAAQALRSGQVSGVARLRAMADLARARADALQRLVPAVEALYAVLTPAQQQEADRDMERLTHRGR